MSGLFGGGGGGGRKTPTPAPTPDASTQPADGGTMAREPLPMRPMMAPGMSETLGADFSTPTIAGIPKSRNPRETIGGGGSYG